MTPVPQSRIHQPQKKTKTPKVVWQYEGDHGFEAFKDDCQEFIERKYKEHHDHAKGKVVMEKARDIMIMEKAKEKESPE